MGRQVKTVCDNEFVNIRVDVGTKYRWVTSVKDDATFVWLATVENGWHAIVVNGQVGRVSDKYSKIA